jgi:hypothetical protein
MSNGRRISELIWIKYIRGTPSDIWIRLGIIAGLVVLTVLALTIEPFHNLFVILFRILDSDESNPEKLKYLLSATTQVLGAVFAIVFSITPIVVQRLTRYISQPERYVFHSGIIAYIAAFAVAIIIPLLSLGNPTATWSFVSLGVGSFFILSF